jgi:hypothetical protein
MSFSTSTSTTSTSTTTYYDSQSGLHLPVHNDQEIRLFLNLNPPTKVSVVSQQQLADIVIPHQLYQSRDEADEMREHLETMVTQWGIHGWILPPLQFPRDIRNLKTLSTLTPSGFSFLYSQHVNEMNQTALPLLPPPPPQQQFHHENMNTINSHISTCCCSRVLSLGQLDLLECMQKRVQDRQSTTLWIQQDHYQNLEAAISLANQVATIIDSLGGRGCEYIWLSHSDHDDSDDKVVQVCEELIYLDVAGPTIKSRLLVDVGRNNNNNDDDDIIESVMMAGVNKFVIQNVSQVDRIERIASEQGKRIDKDIGGGLHNMI